ncbi:PRA1 family protein [Rhynchospora pubera]|uniref:PRA1 family protein n=1 Tax=Rhynchospora pubera TaxID=906938 RepID=A0AAV8EI02_9POAL|nr:PRA1 family protein [Rhynchospora pubera]
MATTSSPPPILPISTTTSPPPTSSRLSLLISRLSSSLRRSLTLARPWPELLDPSSFSPRPDSLPSAIHRLRRNLSYFRLNYSLFLLFTLSLSLLSHPFSLLLLLSLLSAWCFLYLFRPADSPPLLLLRRQFSSREVALILSAFSFFLLFFTSLGSLIIHSLLVGLAIVCVHGALRVPEDLFLDEQEAAAGSVAGAGAGATGLLSFLSAAAASATANPASHV